MGKNFSTKKKFWPFSDPDPNPGFGSRSETKVSQQHCLPVQSLMILKSRGSCAHLEFLASSDPDPNPGFGSGSETNLKAQQLCLPGDLEGLSAGRSVLGRAPPRPSPGSRPARSRSAADCPPAPRAAFPPPAAGQTRRIQSVPTGSRSASASAGWSTLHILETFDRSVLLLTAPMWLISVPDTWHFGTDPDHTLFVSDFHDAKKKKKFLICFAYLLSLGTFTFTSVFKDKKSLRSY